jgi:hypothetical protein
VLAVQLLERTSRGAELTTAGASFLTGTRATLAQLDRAATTARNSARAITGVLPVGPSVAAGGDLPTARLAEFRRAEPQVEIRLRSFELTRPLPACLTTARTWRSCARRYARTACAASCCRAISPPAARGVRSIPVISRAGRK